MARLTANNGLPTDPPEGDPVEDENLGAGNTEPDEDGTDDEDDGEDPEGAEALGDPGKKALNAMKQERNEQRKLARQREAEIAELKKQLEAKDRSPEENELEQARAEARAEEREKANARILRSEVKSAAAGKLRNPADALKFLDLTDFGVDDEGNVDAEQVQEAISDLLDEKPYLAAQGGDASFDSGRGKQPRKKKLTQKDLAGMSAAAIAAAYDKGEIES